MKSFTAPTLQCKESDLTLGVNVGTIFAQCNVASQAIPSAETSVPFKLADEN